MVAGDIAPQAHACGNLVVTFRSSDQGLVATVGKPRFRIGGRAEHHGPVASLHQHIGHRLVERAASRDGEQMLLALRSGNRHEGFVVEPLGLFQHRPGHIDLIVRCETPADH